jgi:hypothetical protein
MGPKFACRLLACAEASANVSPQNILWSNTQLHPDKPKNARADTDSRAPSHLTSLSLKLQHSLQQAGSCCFNNPTSSLLLASWIPPFLALWLRLPSSSTMQSRATLAHRHQRTSWSSTSTTGVSFPPHAFLKQLELLKQTRLNKCSKVRAAAFTCRVDGVRLGHMLLALLVST